MPDRKKILIIGGGIGGLAAALALRRRGMEAQVYEQAEELREIGAGLSIWPNAMWVLRELNLLAKALERGSRVDRLLLQTWNGRILAESRAPSRCETPSLCIHRADLLALLKEASPHDSIFLGRRFVKMKAAADRITAFFENGAAAEGDALVGADGLYSAVREEILGPGRPIYRGYQAWRGIAKFQLPEKFSAAACETWGAGRRFGFMGMGAGRCYWYATQNAAEKTLGEPANWKSEVAGHFKNWVEPILGLVDATPNSAILKHEVFDRSPVRGIGAGRATLLGDASNPTTPNLGQGGCMALEDAWVLGECLAGSRKIPEALREYESRRYARRKFITLESRRIGRMGQWRSGAAVALRTLLVRSIPAALTNSQHRRYYAFPE